MLQRFIQGAFLSCMLAIAPTAMNLAALKHPQLWLFVMIGIVATVFQPSYKPFVVLVK